MKTLSCRDLGVTDCDFVARGNTPEEVKNNMMNHAKMEHKEMMDKMSNKEKDEMKEKMDSMMKEG